MENPSPLHKSTTCHKSESPRVPPDRLTSTKLSGCGLCRWWGLHYHLRAYASRRPQRPYDAVELPVAGEAVGGYSNGGLRHGSRDELRRVDRHVDFADKSVTSPTAAVLEASNGFQSGRFTNGDNGLVGQSFYLVGQPACWMEDRVRSSFPNSIGMAISHDKEYDITVPLLDERSKTEVLAAAYERLCIQRAQPRLQTPVSNLHPRRTSYPGTHLSTTWMVSTAPRMGQLIPRGNTSVKVGENPVRTDVRAVMFPSASET